MVKTDLQWAFSIYSSDTSDAEVISENVHNQAFSNSDLAIQLCNCLNDAIQLCNCLNDAFNFFIHG